MRKRRSKRLSAVPVLHAADGTPITAGNGLWTGGGTFTPSTPVKNFAGLKVVTAQ